MLKVVFGGAVFAVGAAVALWKIRTLPLEIHLLYLFRRRFLMSKRSVKVKDLHLCADQFLSTSVLSASLGVPARLSGVLKDLVSDVILADKIFNICVDGAVYSKISTDKDGCFSTYFIPNRLGQLKITIVPEASEEPIQQITLQVNPAKVKKEDDEDEKEDEKRRERRGKERICVKN